MTKIIFFRERSVENKILERESDENNISRERKVNKNRILGRESDENKKI